MFTFYVFSMFLWPHDTKPLTPYLYILSVSILDWTGLDEDEDAHVWEDNWDDDNVEDDFSNQLR